LKKAAAETLSSATNVAEAKNLKANGVDAIIAQSCKFGSHRGSFLGGVDTGNIAAMALIPQVPDAMKISVIAAGASWTRKASKRRSPCVQRVFRGSVARSPS
jgi:nitronate monooxygenase